MPPARTALPRHSRVDLDTIRETFLYVLSDTAGDPVLAGVTAALQRAIAEIEVVQSAAPPVQPKRLNIVAYLPQVSARMRSTLASQPDRDPDRVDAGLGDGRPTGADRVGLEQAISAYFKARKVKRP